MSTTVRDSQFTVSRVYLTQIKQKPDSRRIQPSDDPQKSLEILLKTLACALQ